MILSRAKSVLAMAAEGVAERYGEAVGRPAAEAVTPALLLDLPAARRNIRRMAEQMAMMPTALRPHIKVHKSTALSRLQVEAGAIGVSTATVWEASIMGAAGLDDLFVVNTVAHPRKIEALAELAAERRVLVAVDCAENAAELSAAAGRVGSTLGVLVEVDTGMDRAGVDDAEQALTLVRRLAALPNLRFDGLTGYEGHCSLEPDTARRTEKQHRAMDLFAGVAGRLAAEDFPCRVMSAGGTATWNLTAADPRLTEIQAGSYVVMDNFHGAMVGGFEHALTVLTTVISAPQGRIIVDAGNKSVGVGGGPTLLGYDLPPLRFDEEHGIFAAADAALKVGEAVRLVPGYAPATVNMYDAFHVVDDGIIVDVWPVCPRGPGHVGLLAPPAVSAQAT